MIGYYILIGVISLLSMLISRKLESKFKHYSQVHLRNNMTGAEIARKMLKDNGITNVEVISTPGMLTDHYNPQNKTVNLSQGVYNQSNAAAAAVAAHECGHALQHAQAYQWLQMRSSLVPVVSITSNMSMFVIVGGLALATISSLGIYVAILGVVLMGLATLFSFVTLPVEYDASRRALAWLKNENMVTPDEYAGAEDALKWAARTYLVAALGALAMLIYWVIRILTASRE